MRKCLNYIALLLLAAAPAHAGLNQVFTQNGNLGIEVAGYANGNVPPMNGNINLTSVPAGAVFVRGTLYASEVTNGTALAGTFNGNPLPTTGPFASDAAFLTMFAYQWDVTAQLIPGVNSYPVQMGTNIGTANQIAGVALVVVWSHPGEPNRTVSIIEGIQQVGETGPETESALFAGMPGGPTTLSIFTVADDNSSTGETVSYNAANVGGPIDQNLGLNASLLVMNTTSLAGANTVAITTGNDHMAWMLATLADTPQATPTRTETWGRIKRLYR